VANSKKTDDLNIVAIIPARAGSKGLPQKNLFPIHQKPLIQWTFEQVLSASKIDHVFVSTNDPAIINLAKEHGVKTILRPSELCTDNATSESALLHALENIEIEYNLFPDIIVFLQATSPLRLKDDIDNAINLFIENKADSLFSTTELSDLTIWQKKNRKWHSLNFDYKKRLRRQDQNPNFVENGSIYIFKPKILKKYNNRIGGKIANYNMNFWQTWELDTIEEVDLIEFFMNKYMVNK